MITYEEIVSRVRQLYENMDARAVWEHVAVQVNVTGEGSGIFYTYDRGLVKIEGNYEKLSSIRNVKIKNTKTL